MKALRFLRALPLALMLLTPAHAEQSTIVGPTSGPKTMAEVMTTLNAALVAIQSCNSGSTAPANGPSGDPVHYQCWADTSSNPVLYKYFDDTSWVTFGALNTSTHVWTPYRNGSPIAAVATSSSAADLTTGTLPAARLPDPTSSSLGGVQSIAATTSQWLDSISTSGVPHASQPAFSDISGSWACSQAPALTGDVSTSAGSCTTAIGAGKVTNDMLAGSIAASKLIGTDIATVGTITAGTWNGATIAVANGGTGATSDSVARSNLGLAIGSDIQAWDADLDAFALKTAPTGDVVGTTDTQTLTNKTLDTAGTGNSLSINGVAATDNTGTGAVVRADSPALTGAPTATTASASDNSTRIATTAYVDAQVAGGVAGVASLNGETGALVLWGAPQGRLTLASNTPVMAASQTAATTIYYTSSSAGKNVPIYNGASVVVRQICAANTAGACELSVALGANWAADSNYDWFVGLDSGTLRLCSGPDWSAGAIAGSNAVGASARGTGAGSTEIENFDGLPTNKNSMTCRYGNASTFTCAAHECTFVGSTRTDAAGQISFTYGGASTPANLNVWNAYNKEQICTTVYDNTSNWTYSGATPRQSRGSTDNQINFMTGGSSGSIDASISQLVRPAASVGALGYIGIALDSITVMDKRAQLINVSTNTLNVPAIAANTYGGVLGAHYIASTEAGDGTTTTTWFGQSYMTLRACMGM